MSLCKVTNLSQRYGDKDLYREVSFELFGGEHIGVVGQNGTGKSTLINILVGETIPDCGQIKWRSDIRLGYLDQYAKIDIEMTIEQYLRTAFKTLVRLEQEMEACYQEGACGNEAALLKAASIQETLISSDFYAMDRQIHSVAHGLGIDAMGMDKTIGTLSGGQHAKLILAKLLLERPEVLLLDEPTNFLDIKHVTWLADYLSTFPGTFLVVSHDFDFLEQISNRILDIEFCTVKKYYGTYSEFLKQKVHLREDYVRQYQAQQKKIEQTEAFIRKNIAGVNTKIAQGRRKQLARMERIAPPAFVDQPNIRFRALPFSAPTALEVFDLEVGYKFPLLPKLNFTIQREEKLVVTGFNGIGKSTLLKTLNGLLPSISGSFRFNDQVVISYYAQDLLWPNSQMTPLEIMQERYHTHTSKDLRRALAQCGVKRDHVMQAIGTLSGGEQSKVKLCQMLFTPCNFLILDEPSNHLDAEAKESLQDALKKFQGSIILVSHEEKFYQDWADQIFNIEKCFESATQPRHY